MAMSSVSAKARKSYPKRCYWFNPGWAWLDIGLVLSGSGNAGFIVRICPAAMGLSEGSLNL
jgi:hypothetical protein